MTTNRIDTVESYFIKVTRVNSWSNYLFWFSVICSFFVFFTTKITPVNYILNIIFIISTVSYFSVSNVVSLFLLREARNRRRIHLLSNSLGVKLDDEETNLYYNNTHNPSLLRLGINVFENTLFTRRVVGEMAKRERVKVIIYLLIWLILILIRDVDLNFIAIIAQTLFTTGIIVNHIKLELLGNTCTQLFGEFRQFFLNNGLKNDDTSIATILNLVFRYETIVASMGVHLSSAIFDKINPTVTLEWERVKRNLNL